MKLAIGRKLGVLAVGAGSVLSVLFATACSTNPTTGKSQFNALSRDEEVKMGNDNLPAMLKEYGGEVPDPALTGYIEEIGQKLAKTTEADNPSLPWKFTLLNSDVINAFALPGGKVFVSQGLAVEMTNEAELAGVLGHEIGHVTARHINDQVAKQTGFQAIATAAGVALGGESAAVQEAAGYAINVGGQSVLLKFGRDQESEADALGMRYMSKNFYDPKGQLQVMQILDRIAGAGGGSEFFSTHPLPKTRIERISKLLATEYASTQNNPQYQLHEAEFKQRFLSHITVKPKKAEGGPAGTALDHIAIAPAGGRGGLRLRPASGGVRLDQPVTWCVICQREEAVRQMGVAR